MQGKGEMAFRAARTASGIGIISFHGSADAQWVGQKESQFVDGSRQEPVKATGTSL